MITEILKDERKSLTFKADVFTRWDGPTSGTYTAKNNACKPDPSVSVLEFVAPTYPPASEITADAGYVFSSRSFNEDNDSFKKIVRSGTIKMTPYSWIETSLEYSSFELQGKPQLVVCQSKDQYGRPYNLTADRLLGCPGGQPPLIPLFSLFPDVVKSHKIGDVYYGHGYATRVRDHVNLTPYSPPALRPFERELEALKSNVVSSLYNKWDAMTDLFEARAAYSTLKNVHRKASGPISSLKRAMSNKRGKLSLKESANSSRGQWLEYRYGVMPLVYSATDALEVISKVHKQFDSERGSISIPLDQEFYDGSFRIQRSGTITITVTGKARFETPSDRARNQISSNLAKSIWETTKYSLVVDWFVNVGDFLTAHFTNFSAEHKFCHAVSIEYVDMVFETASLDGVSTEGLVKTYQYKSYNRTPFTNHDVKLHLRNRLNNYKTFLDAIAMGVGPINKVLRRLR